MPRLSLSTQAKSKLTNTILGKILLLFFMYAVFSCTPALAIQSNITVTASVPKMRYIYVSPDGAISKITTNTSSNIKPQVFSSTSGASMPLTKPLSEQYGLFLKAYGKFEAGNTYSPPSKTLIARAESKEKLQFTYMEHEAFEKILKKPNQKIAEQPSPPIPSKPKPLDNLNFAYIDNKISRSVVRTQPAQISTNKIPRDSVRYISMDKANIYGLDTSSGIKSISKPLKPKPKWNAVAERTILINETRPKTISAINFYIY